MRCGVLCYPKRISVGFGWLLTIKQGWCWHTPSANARMKFFGLSRNCWNHFLLQCFIRMTGAVIPETFRRTPILSARKIHKQSNARILLYALISKGCAVEPFAFPNPLRCMTLSLALLSTFGSSGSFMRQTTGVVHDHGYHWRLCRCFVVCCMHHSQKKILAQKNEAVAG